MAVGVPENEGVAAARPASAWNSGAAVQRGWVGCSVDGGRALSERLSGETRLPTAGRRFTGLCRGVASGSSFGAGCCRAGNG